MAAAPVLRGHLDVEHIAVRAVRQPARGQREPQCADVRAVVAEHPQRHPLGAVPGGQLRAEHRVGVRLGLRRVRPLLPPPGGEPGPLGRPPPRVIPLPIGRTTLPSGRPGPGAGSRWVSQWLRPV